MADRVRFEIFIPAHYTTLETRDGRRVEVEYEVDRRQLQRFMDAAFHQFGGITEPNPFAGVPYQGRWRSPESHELFVDDIKYILIMVNLRQARAALQFFRTWKRRLEERLHQDVILINFWQVQSWDMPSPPRQTRKPRAEQA